MFIKSSPLSGKACAGGQKRFGTRGLLRAILRAPLVVGALVRCSVAATELAVLSLRTRSVLLWQCVAGIPVVGTPRTRRRSKHRARRTQHHIPLLRIEQFEPRTLFNVFHFTGAATASIDVPYTLSLQTDSTSVNSWSINWGDGNTQSVSGNPSTVQHTYTAGGADVDISARATDNAGTHQATLLSPSFPSTSTTVTLDDGNSDFQTATVQPGGYLLALGASIDGTLTVTRYLPDGTLDTSFGSSGTASAPAAGGQDWPQIATYGDGKILVSCVSWDSDTEMSCFIFARFNADGSLDTGFGDEGVVTLDTSDYFELDGMATASDGSFYFASFGEVGDSSFHSVTHINDNGSVDTSFGDDGTTTLDNYAGNEGSSSLALRSDGHLFLGSQTYDPDTGATQGYISELNDSGSVLQTVSVPAGGSDSSAMSVAVDSQGRVLVFSSLNSLSAGSAQVSRFTSSLSVDTSFGSSGRLAFTNPSTQDARTVSLLGDDSFIVGGLSGSTPIAWIYDSSGSLMSSTTLPVSRFAGLVAEPDGHMYAFGTNDLNIASSGYVEIDNTALVPPDPGTWRRSRISTQASQRPISPPRLIGVMVPHPRRAR
jgi:uncharacterized delta-60 repeat protein